MRWAVLSLLTGALLAHAAPAGEVEVRASAGLVDVRATTAAVADVLDRLSQQTGMRVVYEGAPPRNLVTVTLARRTPAEAVLAVLEGLGLNYALEMDAQGSPRTLLIAGAAGTASSSPAASGSTPEPSLPAAARRPPPRPLVPRPVPPDAEEDAEEEEPDVEPDTPPGSGAQGATIPLPGVVPGAIPGMPGPLVFPAGVVPRPGITVIPTPPPLPGASPAPAPTPTPEPIG